MNKKFFSWLAIALLVASSFSACGKDETGEVSLPKGESSSSHAHAYELAEWDESHHWTECDCGESADKEAHDFNAAGKCTVCDFQSGTEGLEYTLSADGSYYTVSGLGSVSETEIAIASVYQGKRVKAVGKEAFKSKALTGVILPDTVTEIEEGAFWFCDSLTEIALGEGLERIGKQAFYSCSALEAVDFPNALKEIQAEAFYFAGLKSVTLPQRCTTVGIGAFKCISALTSAELPDTLTVIPTDMFFTCTNLDVVTYVGSEEEWAEVEKGENWAFGIKATSVTCTDGDVAIG